MTQSISRRLFLGGSVASLGYFFAASKQSAVRAADRPNGKIYMAGIGVGGKGSSDIDQAGKVGEVVAICDIDDRMLAPKAAKWPNAKSYFDFRKMLDEMGKDIDAVVVSTPDHTHAPASLMAMRMKKHVYCQKPMTHTVFEARLMRETAKKMGVCTQMGNQGTAENGLRRAVELVQSGLIGKVKEVHVWTNRPVWPQAPGLVARPKEEAVPGHVHWDEFIGPAPMRPYAAAYHPFKWRGFWDFGTGALGDMACHTANMAFMALQLGSPTSIEAKSGDLNPETYPAWAHVVMQFPARGELVPVTWNWYEGKTADGKKVLPPEELLKKVLNEVEAKGKDGNVEKKLEKLADSGSILVGDKGILFSPNDYGAAFRIIGVDTKDMNLRTPEKLPINGNGDQGMKSEWAEAIKANKPEVALSNFDYAGMLTEAVLLGNVAIRTKKKLEFDAKSVTCTNCKDAAQYLNKEYRKGWEITEKS
jgi:predicted dehydrogenase